MPRYLNALFPLNQPLCQSCVQFSSPFSCSLVHPLSIFMDHPLRSLSRSYVASFCRLSWRIGKKESGGGRKSWQRRVSISSWFGIRDNLSLLSFTGPPSGCSVASGRTTENQSCPPFLNSNGPSLSLNLS